MYTSTLIFSSRRDKKVPLLLDTKVGIVRDMAIHIQCETHCNLRQQPDFSYTLENTFFGQKF